MTSSVQTIVRAKFNPDQTSNLTDHNRHRSEQCRLDSATDQIIWDWTCLWPDKMLKFLQTMYFEVTMQKFVLQDGLLNRLVFFKSHLLPLKGHSITYLDRTQLIFITFRFFFVFQGTALKTCLHSFSNQNALARWKIIKLNWTKYRKFQNEILHLQIETNIQPTLMSRKLNTKQRQQFIIFKK